MRNLKHSHPKWSVRVFGTLGVLVGLLGVSLTTGSTAWAQSRSGSVGDFSVTVEPIVGFEHVQKLSPTAHSKNRIFYGGRVIAGIPKVSGELEVTRGHDTEVYAQDSLTVRDQSDRAKLGVRSSLRLSDFLTATLRAGGQASRSTREETRDGVTSNFSEPLKIRPYAGTGARLNLSNKISASLEIVAVFADTSDLSKMEYQTTAGFSVRFP